MIPDVRHRQGASQSAYPALPASAPRTELIVAATAVAIEQAACLFGRDTLTVAGHTERGCCVHLTVSRAGELLACWRYEPDGRIVPDRQER